MEPVSLQRGEGDDGEGHLPLIEPSGVGPGRRSSLIGVVLDVADASDPGRAYRGVVDPDAGILLFLDGELDADGETPELSNGVVGVEGVFECGDQKGLQI